MSIFETQKTSLDWLNSRWQIVNVINSTSKLPKEINLSEADRQAVGLYNQEYRFQLTPYLLSVLVGKGNILDFNDPFVQLFFPPVIPSSKRIDVYDAVKEMNWEMPDEICVPGSKLWQWKYTDRICYRSVGCMSICTYCFEAHRTMDRDTTKKPSTGDWEKGIEWIRGNPKIREFLFSGGDPLLLSDERLEKMLEDVRSIPHIETIRFNSAFLMHCPMRITPKLVELFIKYNVTELGVHVVDARQFTSEAVTALRLLDQTGIIRLAQIPLLKGITDNTEKLRKLLELCEFHKVSGYYLTHGMPWTINADRYRTPVKVGVDMLTQFKRHLSNVAFPEYVIVARGGKKEVPLEYSTFYVRDEDIKSINVWAIDGTQVPLCELSVQTLDTVDGRLHKFDGTPEFMYTQYKDMPVIVFKNWKGVWEMYLDDLQ
jgi:lysine 2,3-aminomutase